MFCLRRLGSYFTFCIIQVFRSSSPCKGSAHHSQKPTTLTEVTMGQVYSLFRAGTVTPGQDQDERPKTTAPVHHQNERPFDFIGLPGEIRLMVYRYCIPHKLNIQLERISYASQRFRCAFKEVDVVGIGRLDIHTNIATSLLLVSRACHQEAAQLLYAQNAFSFAEYACEQPRNWIRAIGPGNAAQIRQLEITSADL